MLLYEGTSVAGRKQAECLKSTKFGFHCWLGVRNNYLTQLSGLLVRAHVTGGPWSVVVPFHLLHPAGQLIIALLQGV